MSDNKRYNFKKILAATLWILVGMGTIVLLGAAMYKRNSNQCKGVEISIEGVKNNLFIDKADVNAILEKLSSGKFKAKPIKTFDLAGMETVLERNKWIKSAELYFDNNDVLRINIIEREPIVRIFNSVGSSFYIDSSLKKLPLSSKFSARLPVFTNFPAGDIHSKAGKALLNDIKNIGTYILQDAFWMAQIDQIDITPQYTFEMVPKVGNQLIIFGSAENYEEKFTNLLVFYKNVQSKVGWNKYSKINVSYEGQVVAVKRGADEIKLDSLKTIQLIKMLMANAQKQANDSSNNVQLVQPKDDNVIPFARSLNEEFVEEQAFAGDAFSLNPIDHHTTNNQTKITGSSFIKVKSNEKPNSVPSNAELKSSGTKHPVKETKNDY